VGLELDPKLLANRGRAAVGISFSSIVAPFSLGAALAFESDAYRDRRERLLSLLEGLGGADALARLEAAEALEEIGEPEATLLALRALLRDIVALRVTGGKDGAALNADVADRLAILAQGPLGARAGALAEAVGEAQEALAGNASKLLTFDLLVDALAS
jgi:hypothetical protein